MLLIQKLSSESSIITGTLPDNVCPTLEQLMSLKPSTRSCVDSTPYFITKMKVEIKDIPDILQPLFSWANQKLKTGEFGLSEDRNNKFNQFIVIFYLNGHHYIDEHTDDHEFLKRGSPIFSASFGEKRVFRIKKDENIVKYINTTDRSYLVMCGEMQKEFTHEILREDGEKGLDLGPRINVTFRCFDKLIKR